MSSPPTAPAEPTDRPIFIVGFSRSGTSLLRAMLNAHPNIYISQESAFYQWLRPDRLKDCATAAAWLRGYSRTASCRLLRVSPVPILETLDPQAPRSQAARLILPRLLGASAARVGRARWGDKTPLQSLRLEPLFQDFPDAAVIHVTRHPVGVADSLARMPWGCDSGVFNGLLYRAVSERVARWGDRVLHIRLEELVEHPERELRRALEHVHEPWSPDVLEHAAHAPTTYDPPLPWLSSAERPIRASQAAPRLSPAQIRLIESAAGPALAAEGYQPWPLTEEPRWTARAAELCRDLGRGARFLARLLRAAPPLGPASAIDASAQLRFLFHLNPAPDIPERWREIPPDLDALLRAPL